MSVDWCTLHREARRDAVLDYDLHGAEPLRADTMDWMGEHGKRYRPDTLARFGIGEAWLTCYRREAKRRRSLWTSRVITIPVGPVTRCYRFEEYDKAERWRVVPSGLHPQWIGDLTSSDVLVVEGEWDCMAAFDHGFAHTATHTGGAGTWLAGWTPMFTNKHAVVCYDRDAIGMRGAAKVARALWPVAASVRIVDLPLPGTSDAKDLSDFFRLGGTEHGFEHLVRGARRYAGSVYSPRRGPRLSAGRAHLLRA